MSLDSSTLAELDALTLAELDALFLGGTPTLTDAELLSLLQFNLRAFTRILPSDLSTGGLQHLLGLYPLPVSTDPGHALGGFASTMARLGGTARVYPLTGRFASAASQLGGLAASR